MPKLALFIFIRNVFSLIPISQARLLCVYPFFSIYFFNLNLSTKFTSLHQVARQVTYIISSKKSRVNRFFYNFIKNHCF
nr:MAG TPA: hypothetical protein [Caudoviricetes sp.]